MGRNKESAAAALQVTSAVDPITLEVIQSSLINITREMGANLAHSAWSPALTETLDFGLGILNDHGELVAASDGLPFHTFALGFHVRYMLDHYRDDIHPGDLFVTNDPYTAGPHLNDVVVMSPFFVDDRLSLVIGIRAHWTDVGGRIPGSMVGEAREIYEEGIRIPMVRIAHQGVLNQDLWETILSNCRDPDTCEGDFSSQVGTARKAEVQLHELFGRYPHAVIFAAIETILRRSDSSVRNAVAQLPDGEYFYEEYMENTGLEARPVPLRCKLTVLGEEMTFDFTGSAPQVDGPVNAGPAMAYAALFNMIKSYLEPGTPVNSGAMRSVKIILEEGSFLRAQAPASVAAYSECGYLVENAFTGLLSQVMKGKVGAAPESGANHTFLSGSGHDRSNPWLIYEFPRGGTPASPTTDGSHVVMTYDLGDIASILAVEMIEVDNPVLVTRHELRQDSEGAGFRRSGLGGIREIEFVGAGGATLSLMGESAVLPRMGMCGGYPGALNVFKVRRSGEEFHPGPIPSKLAGYPLERGDTVVGKTRGCGGWGDPLTREIERVEQDVAQGYISVERANGAYGVVFTHGSVDRQATEELRRLRSAGRIHAVIESTDSDSHNANYCRICRVSADLALALGVDDGDLIEYVPVGACRSHLKAWVSIDDALTGRVTSLGPVGRSILGVEPGGSVWIRPLLPHGATNP